MFILDRKNESRSCHCGERLLGALEKAINEIKTWNGEKLN